MTRDGLVQRTGKYCSIRGMEYPKFHTGIFGPMESAPGVSNELQHLFSTFDLVRNTFFQEDI